MINDLHPITKALKPILEGICSREVIIADQQPNGSLEISITPQQADFALVCGKAGRQIKAIKWIVERAANRRGIKAVVRLNEAFSTEQSAPVPKHEFSATNFLVHLRSISEYLFDTVPGIRVNTDGPRKQTTILMSVPASDKDQVTTVFALGDIFYPWGAARGHKIDIKPAQHL